MTPGEYMEVAVSCFNAQRQRKKSHAPFEIDFDTSLYFNNNNRNLFI